MLKDRLIIFALLIVVASVVFAGALVWYGTRTPSAGVYGAGATSAQPDLAASAPTDIPVYHTIIAGTVTAVSGNTITVAAIPGGGLGQTTGSDSVVSTGVIVNSQTEIYKQGALKDSAELQKEIAHFQSEVKNANTNVVYQAPDRYVHISVALSGIVVGSYVSIIPTKDTKPGATATAASVQLLGSSK